jgi:hypothetical protein
MRPGFAGPAATTSSGPGWLALDVTEQLRDAYRYGDSGLLLRDLAESGATPAAQEFASREDPAGHRPELAVAFE